MRIKVDTKGKRIVVKLADGKVAQTLRAKKTKGEDKSAKLEVDLDADGYVLQARIEGAPMLELLGEFFEA